MRHGIKCQIGVHCGCAVAQQHGKMHHFAGLARLHNQATAGAQSTLNQVLIHRRDGQNSRNGSLALWQIAIAKDEIPVPRLNHGGRALAQSRQCGFQSSAPSLNRKSDFERAG